MRSVSSRRQPTTLRLSTTSTLACAILAGVAFIGTTSVASVAQAGAPRVLATHPVQNGELLGNTVMFVGYDLAESGTTPTVQVADDTDKSIVPVRVTSRCKKGKTKAAPQRCNVLVRLMKWTVGHRYRAVLHGHTVTFTIVKGDPGMVKRRRAAKP